MSYLLFFLRQLKSEIKKTVKYSKTNFSKEVHATLRIIKANGVYKLGSYFSSPRSEKFVKSIDVALDNKELKIWRDPYNSDNRLYGFNIIDSEVSSYFHDPFIANVVNAHAKSEKVAGFTLAAKLSYQPDNKGSGGGWHRDRCDISQVKTILYLSTVDEGAGPFEYILGSHKISGMIKDWIKYGINPLNSRIDDEKVNRLIASEPYRLKVVTGKAGDLLFADTRGIHRGKPISYGKVRYAMTNYFWHNEPIPKHIQDLLQG